MRKSRVTAVLAAVCLAIRASAAPVVVPGLVPDWNQPYAYVAPAGPGPDPAPGVLNAWNAWCAPTSAANLVGHWQDQFGAPVADGMAFPASPAWPAAGWHDYEADGTGARPAPGGALPGAPTDIGYYMDTNNLGMALGNGPHAGTFLKDIHTGLLTHFTLVDPAGGWTTGTQGRGFAGGLQSDGITPAAIHPNALSAWTEYTNEINAGRTMVVSWAHWNIAPPGLPPLGDIEFYDFTTPGEDPWGNDEVWNGEDGGGNLGHAVTGVGYLGANDPLNPTPGIDWMIVHDNVAQTPVNVAVPFNFNVWVANTNAVPEPATVVLLGLACLAACDASKRGEERTQVDRPKEALPT